MPDGPGFGWDDQTVYKLGFVYKHNPKLTLRAGYNYSDNPVPNQIFSDTFFNSLTPAVTEDHLTLGFTYKLKSNLSITGSYVRTFSETVNGNGLSTLGLGNAPDLKMDQDTLGISFTWHL